ncbi:MAG: hypothetical protein ACRCSP_04025 [Rhodoglobus sp.]
MMQEWWNDTVRWLNSEKGWTIVTSVILPFVSIVVGGVIAGVIARSAIVRVIRQQNREHKASAVAALIASGHRVAQWNALSAVEKDHVDRQVSEAEIRIRLLPTPGAQAAADWAAQQISLMKANSINYSFQVEQDLSDFQSGLITWQSKPSRARKLFEQDLEDRKYEAVASALKVEPQTP